MRGNGTPDARGAAAADAAVSRVPPPVSHYFSPMAELTTKQYDALERAIVDGTRIVVYRRGNEYVLIPLRLRVEMGREALVARHPTTGDRMTIFLDELDSIEVVR